MKIFGSLIALVLILTSPADGGIGAVLGVGILTALWLGGKK